MNRQQKKKVTVLGGLGLLLWAYTSSAATRGKVIVGPVTVTNLPPVKFDKATDAAVQRLSLALLRVRQLLGADPNTLVTLHPSDADAKFVEETIELNQKLSNQTAGVVPWPTREMKMLELARKLPASGMKAVNDRFYALFGIDPNGNNEPTVPLTPASEAAARQLINQWKPLSQDAADTLYAQLDLARELGDDA
jgi:hypothetical protein